jgi:menaquinone-9 beta-reductase
MNDLPSYDVAIIGGGLAGLSMAIQCAAKGISVVLFEKESYPFHKVCGEYISLESKPFLESLGLPFSQLNLPIINQLKISDAKGKMYSFPLPLGGFGISRYCLDKELYKIAIGKGATIFTETKVTNISFENDVFSVESSVGLVNAKVVVSAFGKRSNLDIKWNRPFAKQKANKLNNYVGIKYHIQHEHPADEIVLHNFYNGYCGMSKIEENKSCLCYLTTAENLKNSNNSIDQMEQEILFKNPQLKEIFSTSTFIYKEPLAISQISFSKKSQVESHMLMLGDSAGLITPLCGNGMSMALHSSKLAFEIIESYLAKKISRQQMEELYSKNWKDNFANRLFVGRIVQRMFGGEYSTSLFLKTMSLFPWIATKLIRATHGNPY